MSVIPERLAAGGGCPAILYFARETIPLLRDSAGGILQAVGVVPSTHTLCPSLSDRYCQSIERWGGLLSSSP